MQDTNDKVLLTLPADMKIEGSYPKNKEIICEQISFPILSERETDKYSLNFLPSITIVDKKAIPLFQKYQTDLLDIVTLKLTSINEQKGVGDKDGKPMKKSELTFFNVRMKIETLTSEKVELVFNSISGNGKQGGVRQILFSLAGDKNNQSISDIHADLATSQKMVDNVPAEWKYDGAPSVKI
ncbi:hypothetical protein GCL60_04845 [Silvanigrella paludirubra]|jgi:hypothetical protein|uniref:Uncharacterized protein n=1 Tax=Silvanigrella paludirubra TaxID=2499159 RepID=A0A6N6VYV6_9BACT|nr:hypothetical protein [Silvanigrella paludirubra]KAB8039588.1 hypothetical protein GCL60_04845 [Silvanigrella paludirubra]